MPSPAPAGGAQRAGDAVSQLPPLLGDLPPDALRAALHRVADWVADYRESISGRAITPPVAPGGIACRLPAVVPVDPASLAAALAELDRTIMPGIVHWGHPAFLGYFGSTSNGPALIGEIVAAALNVSAMSWRVSPAATELEAVVLDWIREMVGLPATFTGVVYDTASVGVLHALAAARERGIPGAGRLGLAGSGGPLRYRVYASDQAHVSVDKALAALGLGSDHLVRLPTDAAFRLDVDALRRAMAADAAAGIAPLAVVATVGTTSTTSVDPVDRIAQVCREAGAWLHVDAAYGGALAILPEGRWAMAGAELADSIIINPHKWMFVPLDFSVLYTRRPELLRAVFGMTPDYLQGDAADRAPRVARDDADGAIAGPDARTAAVDYMDYGIQLGRRFRALKAWMVFRTFGRHGIETRIREHCRLAQCWARWVADDPLFELAAPVPMAVVCFRCVPPDTDERARDALNADIVEAVNASGETYLTRTRVAGRVVMRVGIGNILTTEADLARAWQRVRAEASRRPDAKERRACAAPGPAAGSV